MKTKTLSNTLKLALVGSLTLALAGCPNPGVSADNKQGLPDSNVQNGVDLMKLTHAKTLPVGKGPHGIWLADDILVNANPSAGTIDLIDPAAESVIKTLTFTDSATSSPSYVKATHEGKHALVLDGGAMAARVIKASTREQVQKIDLAGKPSSKFVWGADHVAYVPVTAPTDGTTNVVKVTWPMAGGHADFDALPATASMVVNRDGAALNGGFLAAAGGYLATVNGPDNHVAFVALDANGDASGAVTVLQHGNNPGPIDISTYGGGATLIYGNKNSNTVVLYDLAKKSVKAILNVGSTPTDMSLRSDGRYAYMTCKGSGEVAVIDVANSALVSLLKVGRGLGDKTPNPVHIYRAAAPSTGGNEQMWVGGDGDDSVTVIDTASNKVIAVVALGVGHHKMAFTPTKAFISNITDSTVSVIDRSIIK